MKRRMILLALLAGCHQSGDDAIRATGTVEVRQLDVTPQVAARVIRVLKDEGEPVRAGDTLVVLTQSTTRADIAGQEARVRAAEASLREAVAGPRQREIQRAQANLRAADADVDRTARELERVRRRWTRPAPPPNRRSPGATRRARRCNSCRRAPVPSRCRRRGPRWRVPERRWQRSRRWLRTWCSPRRSTGS